MTAKNLAEKFAINCRSYDTVAVGTDGEGIFRPGTTGAIHYYLPRLPYLFAI